MLEEKYIYSLILANKIDKALELLSFFLKKSDSCRLIIYNTDEIIVKESDHSLESLMEILVDLKSNDLIPCYLELKCGTQVIFDMDTENRFTEYANDYHDEYINYIISLIGYSEINTIHFDRINDLISRLELILLNKLHYLKAVEEWGKNNVIPFDENQIINIFSGEYKILFNLYPDDISNILKLIKNGKFDEQYFQKIVFQNILIRLFIEKNEKNFKG